MFLAEKTQHFWGTRFSRVTTGITAESLENKSEVVQGLRRYYEVMDNTRTLRQQGMPTEP